MRIKFCEGYVLSSYSWWFWWGQWFYKFIVSFSFKFWRKNGQNCLHNSFIAHVVQKGWNAPRNCCSDFSTLSLSNFGGNTMYFDLKFLRKLCKVNIKATQKERKLNFEGTSVKWLRYEKRYETVLLL